MPAAVRVGVARHLGQPHPGQAAAADLSETPGILPGMSDRDELAGVVSQVHAWAELDRLFGVGSTVAPRLSPLPPVARVPAAHAISPAVAR